MNIDKKYYIVISIITVLTTVFSINFSTKYEPVSVIVLLANFIMYLYIAVLFRRARIELGE